MLLGMARKLCAGAMRAERRAPRAATGARVCTVLAQRGPYLHSSQQLRRKFSYLFSLFLFCSNAMPIHSSIHHFNLTLMPPDVHTAAFDCMHPSATL